jgi:hypothetical protein
MSDEVQSRFLNFHEKIKLTSADENATLREKREAVLKRMRDHNLTFEWFNQGSYAMGTGVVPVKADYDIDVGIVFTGDTRPVDPLAVKQWVYDAVYGHTKNVEWRRHCLRVQYVKAGEPTYHVDLPVYWKDRGSNALTLAVGKQHSGARDKAWQAADPQRLVTHITSHFDGEDREQFRRVIRYMKRWKDEHFPVMGNAAPVGIGLTIFALDNFVAKKDWTARYNDLDALHHLVNRMRRAFTVYWFNPRIVQKLPVTPNSDVFARMTDQQMKEFKGRIDTLAECLDTAKITGKVDTLVRAFGSDFPAH